MSNQTTLGHVIQRWFDMNGQDGGAPVTWTAILNVIKGPLVQNIALARKIYEYLKEQSSVQQSGKLHVTILIIIVILEDSLI